MGGNRSFDKYRGRRGDTSAFDEFADDGDEPFEQALPGALDRTSRPAVDPDSHPHAHSAPAPPSVDTFSRSSERAKKPLRYREQGTRSGSLDTPGSSPTKTPTPSSPRNAALAFKRSLRGRALGYLSRREHSRDELTRKLTPYLEDGDTEDAITILLDALTREGWLSDARFAESVVNRRAARFGQARIVGELKRHKVDPELITELGGTLRESEWDRIRVVWGRKFGTLPVTPQERAKHARFLASRGFSRDLIIRVLKLGDDELADG